MRTLNSENRVAKVARPALFLAAALPLAVVAAGCSFGLAGPSAPDVKWSDAIPRGFSFATTRSIDLSLDITARYDGQDQPFAGEIGVFTPSADGNGSYDLLGSGTTGSDGKVQFQVLVPTTLTSITIRPTIAGLFERVIAIDPLTTSLTLAVSPNDTPASIPGLAPPSLSKALVAVGSTGLKFISTFDAQGVPAALEPTREDFSLAFLNDITATLPEYRSLPATHPAYIDTVGHSNLSLTADAEVTTTFINEGAGYMNSLGYFVYRTADGLPATPPPLSSIVVAFPNTSLVGSGGGLHPGDRVKLVNPNDGTTLFMAGTTIVWVLMAYAWNGSQVVGGNPHYFSIPELNPEPGLVQDKAHVTFLLYDKPANHNGPVFLLAFEDMNRTVADNDFNDVVFSVSTNPVTSVSSVGVPQVTNAVDTDGDGVPDSLDQFPNDPLRSASVSWPSATTYSTALFEDAWPFLGDYDFNDVVANVRYTTTRNSKGEAVETILNVRLRAAGGGLPSALALTVPVPSASVRSVKGQSLKAGPFAPGSNGVEADGANSVVPIYSDSHTDFGVAGGKSLLVNTVPGGVARPEVDYQVVVTYESGVLSARLSATPDVFVVVGGNRGHEIHAIGKMPGTRATAALFGTGADASVVGLGPYYRATNGAPWALLVPAELPWTTERTEISTAYLKFGDWVKSGGTQYPDWYQNKAGYRDNSNLYQ